MGCITMEAWMFLSSYEKLRHKLIDNYFIASLSHFGWHIIGIAFGTAMTIFEKNRSLGRKGEYSYLTIDDIDKDNNIPLIFPLKNNGRYAVVSQYNFEKIPGNPIGYWVSQILINAFSSSPSLSTVANTRIGLVSGDNPHYLRYWREVSTYSLSFFNEKGRWFPLSKGGVFRRWYGNNEVVIDWQDNGYELKTRMADNGKRLLAHNFNGEYALKEGITLPAICSGIFSARIQPEGFFFDSASTNTFLKDKKDINYVLGLLNTIIVRKVLDIVNPTLNILPGYIDSIPFIYCESKSDIIYNLVHQNIIISKLDWDAHETSWDFEENPLLKCNDVEIEEEGETVHLGVASGPLKVQYEHYKAEWTQKFKQLHANEEELNRQFIEIYGLQDELTPDVPLDEITILQQGEISIEDNQIKWHADVVMKQLISYAIGCMMGRYRLDKKGLCIAHPNPDESEYAPYQYHGETFEIDEDSIIPLMPKDSRFDDNAVNRLTDFIKIVFGVETLTDNMNFLEESLGKSVEQYLIKDFWKDHKKMYQNRPIYWLFSSKKGAFQVIAYMHRMNKYTAETIRNKYLLPHIDYLRQELAGLDSRITALTPQERKLYQKLQKDLEECMEYHDRLHSVADQQIDFDLDDGVVVNYAKFGDVLAKLK